MSEPTGNPHGPRPGERSDDFRARMLAELPASYSPWLHLGLTVGSGLVVLAVAIAMMPHPDARAWLAVPLTLLFANAVEWRAHKDVLHHRVQPLAVLYDRHTPQHHVIFTHEDMALRSQKEMYLVLIPPFGVGAIVVLAAPLATLTGLVFGAAAGWMLLATSALYVVAYELSHLAYHMPEDSFIGRRTIVRVLREHHRRHHDPRLMQKWNFNVTVPLFDWVHGTIAPPELAKRTLPREPLPTRAG